MRILVISEVPTHPATAGNRSYLKSICDCLKGQGHEVDFLHVVTYTRHPRHRLRIQRPRSGPEMAAAWGSALHIYETTIRDIGFSWAAEPWRRPRLRSKRAPIGLTTAVETLVCLGRYDAVVVNYWNLLSSVGRLCGVRRILVTNESYADKTVAEAGWMATERKTEDKALNLADVVLAIQDDDADDFKARTGARVLTTYHYATPHQLPMGDAENLLFLGSDNAQNIEGMNAFLNEIFPVIRSEFSNVRLLIAGPICDAVSKAELPDGVVLQGIVDNVADFYAQGNMCISPNLQGGGLKTKILEALAHGRTVLASPYSMRDMPWADAAPLISCSSASEYIDAIGARMAHHELLAREQERALRYAQTMNTHFERAISLMMSR